MAFDLSTWKQAVAEKAHHIGDWARQQAKAGAPYALYGTLCGMSLWPLLEAAQSGQFLPVMLALGAVGGGVGGNLIAEQIQRWKDSADQISQEQVAQWTSEQAGRPEMRDTLDAMLEKVEAIPAAQAGLDAESKAWFAPTLREELTQLGNLARFEAVLIGDRNVVIGKKARNNIVITGKRNRVVKADTYIEKQEVHQAAPPSPVELARQRYLECLSQRCNVLPLAALGGDEEASEEISLDKVYVDLDTRTRVALSEEEKKKRKDVFQRAEDRPLSALEAATQHPRLVLLGDPGGGKSTFVRQLAAWQAAACLGTRQPPAGWEACLLPLLTVLRDLAPRLAALKLEGLAAQERDRRLVEAVRAQWAADLTELEAAELAPALHDALIGGEVLLIFDGLDEVAAGLRGRVRQAVQATLRAFPRVRKIILTCRIRSYSGPALMPDFAVHTLAPFDQGKIRRFISAWYNAQVDLGRVTRQRADENTADLQRAALEPSLRELSSNPMLLTAMAIIHQREVGLPKERVRLYALAVQVLLSRWQKRKGFEASAPLAAILGDDLKMRAILERLAYEAHRAQAARKGEGGLLRKDLLALLEQPPYLGDAGLASEFLDHVDQRAGLLVGQGGDEEGQKPQAYSFPHRTFQEYLAGCYMVAGRSLDREYRKRAEEGDYWYLAARLGAEELLYIRRSRESLLDLSYDLCPEQMPEREAAWRAALWSGQMAALLGREDVARDVEKPEGGPAYLARLLPRLLQVMRESKLGAIERAEAGRALAKLGDPRPEVLDVDRMEFCLVPAGPFWMGSDKDDQAAYDDERPSHQVNLAYDYWLARYPVTVSQFEAFVTAGGYREPRYWPEARAAKVWDGKCGMLKGRYDSEPRDRPADSGEPYNLANHPAVGLTWYEALAFTRWLTEGWQRAGRLLVGWQARLPSEAEWEKAARGALQIPRQPLAGQWQASAAPPMQSNPKVKRSYPWGDKTDTNLANYDETRIETTSAVGGFPDGVSPYGCEEMSGNVWEWTRSLQEQYPYDPKDGRESFEGDGPRVLRGGSFYDSAMFGRYAFRYGAHPDILGRSFGFRVVLSPF